MDNNKTNSNNNNKNAKDSNKVEFANDMGMDLDKKNKKNANQDNK